MVPPKVGTDPDPIWPGDGAGLGAVGARRVSSAHTGQTWLSPRGECGRHRGPLSGTGGPKAGGLRSHPEGGNSLRPEDEQGISALSEGGRRHCGSRGQRASTTGRRLRLERCAAGSGTSCCPSRESSAFLRRGVAWCSCTYHKGRGR